jgi:hypothetical protein
MSMDVPKCNMTKKTSVAAVVEQWRAVPAYEELLADFEKFAKHMEEGDELWWYQIGSWTGLAVVGRENNGAELAVMRAYFPIANAWGVPVRLRVTWGESVTTAQILAMRKMSAPFYDQRISAVRLILESRGCWEVVVDTEEEAKRMEETCGGVGLTVTRV